MMFQNDNLLTLPLTLEITLIAKFEIIMIVIVIDRDDNCVIVAMIQ